MAKKKNIHRRGRRGKKGFSTWSLGKKITTVLAGTLFGVLVVGIVAGAFYLTGKMSLLKTEDLDVDSLEITEEVEHKTGYLNVALFGVDTREGNVEEGSRSDSIMIASLDQETGEVKVCSVYRDTILQQADGTYNKANAAYSYGGAEEAVALLNKNLDLDITHYVTVDFTALVDVIDDLGGVDIELTEEEVYWTNYYIDETSNVAKSSADKLSEEGLQTLNGVQATSYCRIRYTTGDDFKRAERQRIVLEQIVKKIQSANLSTLNTIINDVFDEVSTNFTLTEILSYAKSFTSYKLGETTGFPFDLTTGTLEDAGSSVIPISLEDNVVQLHQFFFGEDVEYTPSSTVQAISEDIDNLMVDEDSSETDDSSYDSGYGGYTDYSSDYYDNSYYNSEEIYYETDDTYYDDNTYNDVSTSNEDISVSPDAGVGDDTYYETYNDEEVGATVE